MKSEYPYLMDMLEAIEEIESYGLNNFSAFLMDHKTKKATVKNLEIIGEAAKRISRQTRAKAKKIPWPDIIGMRNRLIHEYRRIHYQLVWDTVQIKLPELKQELKNLIAIYKDSE